MEKSLSTSSETNDQLQEPLLEYATHSLWAPTPLDPYAVHRDGISYVAASQHIMDGRLTQKADAIGLEDQFKSIALEELFAAMEVRIERNTKSYDRLVASTSDAQLDDTMHAIIDKARAANADTPELLRLIKEHPGMISVEFFKRTTPFDTVEYRDACAQLHKLIIELEDNFKDAEISHDFSGQALTTEPFLTEHGALVWKERIGEARSADSHIEIIAKHSMLALPPAMQLKGIKRNIIHLESSGQTLNLLPLGVSAYFRTADYKSRPGYNSPEGERRSEVSLDLIAALGERASTHEEIWDNLPDDMRQVYADSVNDSARRL